MSFRKSIRKHVGVEAGFAGIDRYYGDLNSDAFFHGNRVYVGPTVDLFPGLTAFAFLNHTVHTSYDVSNKRHVEFGISYNLKQLVKPRI